MKLVGGSADFEDRAHFLGVAARAMRQVLIDYARRRSAGKRGGDRSRVTLVSGHGGEWVDLDELLALDEALDRLNELNPRLREVVEYRFFGGLSEAEIAHLLDVSTRTVERDWTKARMFLSDQLASRSS
jgi:RNA polymerase sigma factor (TIGR02999 family)